MADLDVLITARTDYITFPTTNLHWYTISYKLGLHNQDILLRRHRWHGTGTGQFTFFSVHGEPYGIYRVNETQP